MQGAPLSFRDPPAPGTALVEELDKRLIVHLRDNRKLVGVLRSFDQFANLVLEGCVERIMVGLQYAEVPLGLYVIRGENVVLLGELDEAADPPPSMTRVSHEEILRAQKAEADSQQIQRSMQTRFTFLNDFD